MARSEYGQKVLEASEQRFLTIADHEIKGISGTQRELQRSTPPVRSCRCGGLQKEKGDAVTKGFATNARGKSKKKN
jgi:hypothetical protein